MTADDLTQFDPESPFPVKAQVVASTWQPIETAPKDGTDVVLWHVRFGIMMGHWDEATCDWWAIYAWPNSSLPYPCEEWFSPFMDGNNETDPSHWMPLPAPPKGGAA